MILNEIKNIQRVFVCEAGDNGETITASFAPAGGSAWSGGGGLGEVLSETHKLHRHHSNFPTPSEARLLFSSTIKADLRVHLCACRPLLPSGGAGREGGAALVCD